MRREGESYLNACVEKSIEGTLTHDMFLAITIATATITTTTTTTTATATTTTTFLHTFSHLLNELDFTQAMTSGLSHRYLKRPGTDLPVPSEARLRPGLGSIRQLEILNAAVEPMEANWPLDS